MLRDLGGRVLNANAAAAAALGVVPDRLLGRTAAELCPPAVAVAIEDADRRVIATGGQMAVEVELETPWGGRAYELVVYPVLGPGGATIAIGSFAIDVTERRRAQSLALERERQLVEAQEAARVGSWELAVPGDRLRWSDELCLIFGCPPGFSPTVEEYVAMAHPDDREEVRRRVGRAREGTLRESEHRIIRPDGEVRWIHTRGYGRRDAEGRLTHLWGTSQDITERIVREQELQRSRAYYETIVAAMGEGYCLTIDGNVSAVNDALCELIGLAREHLIGAPPPFPCPPPADGEPTAVGGAEPAGREDGTFEITLRRPDGTTFEAEVTTRPARNPDGTVLGLVSTFRDVSARLRYERELERLATTDPLTGLANHRAFHERLGAEAARSRRHGRPLSLVILDIDHFKLVNDLHGHPSGDRALREVAGRLRRLARADELLARVGGEEFAWLLPDSDATGALAAAERARIAIRETPVEPAGTLTLSAGVCDLAHAADVTELYRRADEALYLAKRGGRDRSVCHPVAGP